MKKIFKWIAYIFAAFWVLSILIFIFGGGESSDNQNQAEQAKQVEEVADATDVAEETETATEEAKPQEPKKKNSFLGTYEITDKVGCTIRITLNEDGTSTVTGVRGEDVTYYCSWEDFSDIGAGIRVWYGEAAQVPYLVFDGGDNTKKNLGNPGGCICDGWYYVAYNEAKAKNPRWRLKATKIE